MAMGDIAGLLQPPIDAAMKMSEAFVPLGQVLLGVAVVLALLFATYEWWLGGASSALAGITRAALVLTIPLTLLVGGWGNHMTQFTQTFSQTLVEPILTTTGTGSSGQDAVRGAITRLSNSMFPNERNPDKRNAFEKARDFIQSDQSFGGAIASALSEALIEMVFLALAMFISIALIFALYGPLLALQMGVIFGPLLIAWMPFKPLSHLARSWFQFMLSQGFALVVGVTVAVIGATVVEGFTDSMAGMGADPNLPFYAEIGAKIGGFMASAAVLVFVGFFLFKADDIASAMLGGGGAGMSGLGAAVGRAARPTGGAKPPPK